MVTQGWVHAPRYVNMLTTTAPVTTGDDQKLTWFTPRWSGVQLGASFTPNEKQDVRGFSDGMRERTNVVTGSGNGRWDSGEVGGAVSAGWIHAAGIANPALAADRRHPIDDAAVGAELRYRAVSIGAGFRRLAYKGGALDGRALAAGIAGTQGPVSLAAGFLTSRVAGTATTPGRDRGDLAVLSASYALGAFSSVDAGGRLLAVRLGELERDTDKHRAGVADVERRLRACAALRTEGEHVAKLLDAFDEVWEALVPEERREVLRALIARVGVEPESGTLRVTFHEPAPPTDPQPTTEATP